MHGDGDDVAVALEQLLHARLRQRERVEVTDKDSRVDRLRTVRVREVADFTHRRVCGLFRCNEARKGNKYHDIGWWCNDSVMMRGANVKES